MTQTDSNWLLSNPWKHILKLDLFEFEFEIIERERDSCDWLGWGLEQTKKSPLVRVGWFFWGVCAACLFLTREEGSQKLRSDDIIDRGRKFHKSPQNPKTTPTNTTKKYITIIRIAVREIKRSKTSKRHRLPQTNHQTRRKINKITSNPSLALPDQVFLSRLGLSL